MESINARVNDLRSAIGDLGQEIDRYNAGTAAALGGGVFSFLLAAGAGYDIIKGNSTLWFSFGISREMFYLIAAVLALLSVALLALAFYRERARDRSRDARLVELERELAELLEHKQSITQAGP